MSALVLLSEQPSAVELASLIDRLNNIDIDSDNNNNNSPLQQLAKESKLSALLDAVFKAGAVIGSASDDDFSAVVSLICAVFGQINTSADAAAAANKLCQLLTADPSLRTALKIKLLTNLVNVLGSHSSVPAVTRFQTLMSLFEFAAAASSSSSSSSSTASLVLKPLPALAGLVESWTLSAEQQLALYSVSYKLAQLVGQSKQVESVTNTFNLGQQPAFEQEYLLPLLKAIDSVAESKPAALKEKANVDVALTAAVASIANGLSANLHALDSNSIFTLNIIQSLSSSNSVQATTAFQLLKLIVEANLSGFLSFIKTGPYQSLVGEYKQIDTDLLTRKIRTLALCQLAVANQANISAPGENVLTYSSVREKLLLPADDNEEVEAAVIDAVMAGRIDAKMDQEAQNIIVKRVIGGVPVTLYMGADSKQAWAVLGARIAAWKQNIHAVVTTLNLSQQMQVTQQEEGAEEMQ